MTSKDHDPVTFYKKLEKKWNKRIHFYTNCRSFSNDFWKGVENHLDRVMIHRKLIDRWLKKLDLPNKADIADLALNIINCEEVLDNLEETIYMINLKQKSNQIKLKNVRESLEEIICEFENEKRDFRNYKIKALEKELNDLKHFFHKQTNLDMEEKNND